MKHECTQKTDGNETKTGSAEENVTNERKSYKINRK